jgi:hypothetical protein
MMSDAILDHATLAQLFADIEGAAELIDVRRKGGPEAHASASTLADAAEALRHGEAIQLRYRWGGAEWWDTLMATSTGVRLVRIQHPL